MHWSSLFYHCWIRPWFPRSPQKTRDVELENLLLRHQLELIRQKHPRPYRTSLLNKLFFSLFSSLFAKWKDALFMFDPDTVAKWRRDKFRMFWRLLSQKKHKTGRPKIDWEIIKLIRRMKKDNPTWGSPRIADELSMLGFDVHRNTVLKYIPKTPTPPDKVKKWRAFLKNHANEICAMDFFTIPTLDFKVLYGFLIIHHKTRKLLHFNVTLSPTSDWVKQQLRNAFPWDSAPKYLIFDRGSAFGKSTQKFIRGIGTKPVQTGFRSPWQNGICERVFLSIRLDALDHVIIFNEDHLRKLMKDYLVYYHDDRTHLGLNGQTPNRRKVTPRPSPNAKVVAIPRVGGLHLRYIWKEAA